MEKNSIFWKSTMTNGFLLGLAIIVFMLITYVLGVSTTSKIQWFGNVIFIAGLIYGQRQYRNELINNLGQSASYGKLLTYGIAMSVFAGFLAGIYQYLLFTVIDPGLWERNLVEVENLYLEMGFSEDQVAEMMTNASKFNSPILNSIGMAFGYGLVGFIIALITSAFLKKETEDFDTIMKNIETDDEK